MLHVGHEVELRLFSPVNHFLSAAARSTRLWSLLHQRSDNTKTACANAGLHIRKLQAIVRSSNSRFGVYVPFHQRSVHAQLQASGISLISWKANGKESRKSANV